MAAEDPPEVIVSGPDPRSWPDREEIWGHVADVEAIAQVQAALKGSAQAEAMMLLSVLKEEARASLAAAILAAYPEERPPA